ncbi:hypothetical protein BOTBODRAFT_139894 [Botryobasidium botryosum FD-172 SS1]|uniref:Protein kinase domain-containing protein n=1 Tax=Botryobasidium botryosum (strain FD-172 SS1) TaxID=930990 RepID=A0A067M7P0_BOTB1|nr:hypothetical protein BOTBODRAFT_139894 [Botryobasidium botryosum FD-172 SS1]
MPRMEKLREVMISSPPADSSECRALLFELYSISGMYPWEPRLLDCEVAKTGTKPFAEGGFKACWRGMFLGRQEVAMTCPRPHDSDADARRRALREINVWQDLRHPNILPFLGSYLCKSRIYMLSPLMKEGDIISYLRRNPDADHTRMILQIAYGLLYLHTHDPVVVHGDLKSSNILVGDTGVACLAGFGLSHKEIETATPKSAAFQIGGNPRWQSPELLTARNAKEAERTTASDMFAFGRVIIEVYTEEIPFANIPSLPPIMQMVMNGESPVRPTDREVIERGLDDRIWEIAKDCSHHEPYARLTIQRAISRLLAPLSPPQPGQRSERETRGFLRALGRSQLAPLDP